MCLYPVRAKAQWVPVLRSFAPTQRPVPIADSQTHPEWLVAIDGSCRQDVGGSGAYLVCGFKEARAVALDAKLQYERLLSLPTCGTTRQHHQRAENVARDILKTWAEEQVVHTLLESASDHGSIGSTDMEVRTACVALTRFLDCSLLKRTQSPCEVVLVTDCETQLARLGAGEDAKSGRLQLPSLERELQQAGVRLLTKKVDGHASTSKRMGMCWVED